MKKSVGKKTVASVPGEQPPVFYRVNSLLHTVRHIARYEDQVCTLLHEIQTSGQLNPTTHEELTVLLGEIPSSEYLDELRALEQALHSPAVEDAVRRKRSA